MSAWFSTIQWMIPCLSSSHVCGDPSSSRLTTVMPSSMTMDSSLAGTRMTLRRLALRQKFPERKLVVIGDNFHLYDFPGFQDGEAKTRHMSSFVKGLANKYHATIIMTMELPKTSLQPGVRPRVRNIKGTGGISYDSSLNMGVYNDIKDFGDEATLVDPDQNHKDPVTNAPPYRVPILELVFDKSKINSFDGTIYYK